MKTYKFYFGIVDDLGTDSFAEMVLHSPIEAYRMRARLNTHRNASFYMCMMTEKNAKRIQDKMNEGRYKLAKKLIYRLARYIDLRDKKNPAKTAEFKELGCEYFGKLKMVEEL